MIMNYVSDRHYLVMLMLVQLHLIGSQAITG